MNQDARLEAEKVIKFLDDIGRMLYENHQCLDYANVYHIARRFEKYSEARILTPNELAKLKDGDVVWEQLTSEYAKDKLHPLVKYKGYLHNGDYYVVWPEELDAADYGHSWRCWSAKPTDEQAATPWSELGAFEEYADMV